MKRYAVLMALLLAGCASAEPYDPPEHESRALSITKAAGLMGLRDASLPKGASVPQPGSSLPGAALTGAGNALSAPPGFTSLSAGALGVASMFLSGPSPEGASAYSHLLAWMPRSEATDRVDARDKINAMVQQALADVFAETSLPDGVTAERREQDTFFTEPVPPLPVRFPDRWPYRMTTFRLNGGECSQPKVTCHYQITVGVPPVPDFAPTFAGGYPAWAGGYPAWAFDRLYGLPDIDRTFVDRRNWRERWEARFPDLDVYRKLSARLPGWVYLCAPASVLPGRRSRQAGSAPLPNSAQSRRTAVLRPQRTLTWNLAMDKPTFWSEFKSALPEAAGFWSRMLPAPFQGIRDGLVEFKQLSADGRVGAALLALFCAPARRMIRAILRLWNG